MLPGIYNEMKKYWTQKVYSCPDNVRGIDFTGVMNYQRSVTEAQANELSRTYMPVCGVWTRQQSTTDDDGEDRFEQVYRMEFNCNCADATAVVLFDFSERVRTVAHSGSCARATLT